ncbi:MAG: isochorismatase family protein [Chloroflexi bacterium]|nr:isochorismatase family protein [Chloroflexota bacterium]
MLVVDFTNAFADPARFGGGNIESAIANTRRLLAAARRASLPIAFTRVVYAADGSDAGVFTRKAPGLLSLTEDAEGSQVVPQLAPEPGEHVIRKTQPSAFFGTDLAGWLLGRGVDTVLVAGATTSGCVRASVVDAMSYNLRTVVVRDCVGDRALGPHEANLFDMEQKYADLLTATEAMAAIRRIARRGAASRSAASSGAASRVRG